MTRAEAWEALRKQRAKTLKPPRLMRGPLSGSIFVVTVGKTIEHDGELLCEAQTKYDVTDQFEALREFPPDHPYHPSKQERRDGRSA
jgi:hypothetical protein